VPFRLAPRVGRRRRATLRASLAIARSVAGIETPDGYPLAARLGVATGSVVVGGLPGGKKGEEGLVGEPPNLAARLQALAEPGTIVLADETRKLLGAMFHFRDLGQMRIKGLANPVRAWVLTGDQAYRFS
jgi:class 3 adenylate cyclase